MAQAKENLLLGDKTELQHERLFSLLQNAISYGEWELARVAAKLYYKTTSSNRKDLQTLLSDIIKHPRKYSHGSKTIPSPFHLSWLALILYLELFPEAIEEVLLSKTTRCLIEFKIYLLTLSNDLTSEQEQDSYCFFKLGLEQHGQHENLIGLSKEYRSFISDFAITNPLKCRTLTDFLVNPLHDVEIVQRKSMVGDCYLRLLLSYIGRMQLFEESVQTMFLGECFPVIISAKQYFSSDSVMFINAISSVVKIILEHNPGAINLLYCSLIDRESIPFLMVALELSWKCKLSNLRLQDILEETTYGEDEQNIHVAELLSENFMRESSNCMMTSFQICDYYGVNFLDCILNASLKLVNIRRYSKALELLEPEPMQTLKPLVVLLAWPLCSSFEEKSDLISSLFMNMDKSFEPTFDHACKRLEYNLTVGRKCIIKQREAIAQDRSNDGARYMMEDIDIFQGMDFCSILFVLNKLHFLELLHPDEVIDLLTGQPLCAILESSIECERLKQSEVRTYLRFCVLQHAVGTFIQQNFEDSTFVCNVRTLIPSIKPLVFRLETLEDMFSLLFVRKENFSGLSQNISRMVCSLDDQSKKSGASVLSCFVENGESSGFLFRQDSVKKYLDLLIEWVTELIADKYSEKDKESDDTGDSEISILSSDFDKRISQLRQNLNHAIWRFELVSGFNSGDNSTEFTMKRIRSSREDPPLTTSCNFKEKEIRNTSEHVLSQMLSSPESMAHLCLQKGSLLQAQQVIKVFQLEGHFCGLEVDFADVLARSVEALKATQPAEVSSKSTHLTNIKSAAAAGLLSSSVRSSVNGLLKHKSLHQTNVTRDHPLEDIICFSPIAVCFDLVVSAELHNAVCKTILDISEELIKSVDDSQTEVKSLLTGHLAALKSSIHVYSQITSNQLRDEMHDNTTSFSHFFTRSYRKPRGEGTELTFQKLTQQKSMLEEIVSYIDEGVNEDEVLREDKSPEASLCRNCMNNTLAAYSSESLMLIPEDRARRNYIKTLFRHSDTLARLQLYFRTRHVGVQVISKLEQKSSLSGVKACNPFVVLKDDISVIFGRLLFEWNMPPRRLESIAKQVNINLVKVIAKKFSLSIPVESRKQYPGLTTFLLTRPSEVLNSGDGSTNEQSCEEVPHPVKVIEDLIVLLLSILKALPPTYESHVGSSKIRELVASEEFIDFQKKTKLLKHVDLRNLDDDEARICFMINLYNVMFIHGVLIVISGSLDGTPSLDVSDYPRWTYECLMESPTGRFAIDQFFSYEVGQLGVISAFDLLHHFLLGGISSSYYGDSFRTRHDLFEWTPDRLTYAPSKQEKRCIFMLTHGSASCPTFKLLKPECFNTQLQLAKREYLEQTITIVQNEMKITIPKLLIWHRDLFLERQPLYPRMPSSSSLDCKDRNRLLLEFIKQSSKKLCDQLESMNMENASLRVREFNWTLKFNVGASKPTKKSPKSGKRDYDIGRTEKHYLTEPIKKYIYDASPVSASLICMILEKKTFLHQIGEMIVESRYGDIKLGGHRISSLQKFIEDGIKNLSQSVEADAPLKAFTALCCDTVYKILQSLQVDQPNASSKYVENVQSLINVTVSMLDVCGSVNVESSKFLGELLNVFMCHGGILIAAFFETFPHICPAKIKDRLLCESICGIREWLDDLIEACVAAGEDALKIDLDRISYLTIELKRCLMLLTETYLRCKVTIESIVFFDADEALQILEVCAEDCSSFEGLVSKLKLEAKKIEWYAEIQKLFSSRFHEKQPSERVKLAKWQDCMDFVQYHPEDVTILLIASGSFEQIDFWINNFSVPHHLSKMCLRAKLHDILKDKSLQYTGLYAVLENLPNKHIAYELCDDFLQDTELSTRYLLLLLRYMIENLAELLSADQVLQLRCTELAFKALDQFPDHLKAPYWHLTAKPELIVEQLVMNMKIELAKTVVDIYRESITDDSPLSYLLGKIDELLAFYGEKSLDAPIIETATGKDSRMGTIDRRRALNGHARNDSYQYMAVDNEIPKQEKSVIEPSTTDEKANNEISSTPVDMKRWVADESETTCQICKIQVFSIFNRRHHCRHCGRLSCAGCSSYRCAVGENPAKVRVCKDCFEQFYSTLSSNNLTDENEQSAASDAPPQSEAPSSLSHSGTAGNVPDRELDIGRKMGDDEHKGWQLTVDPNVNSEIRDHFCFDQAPSASLCVAIIEQCSDAQKIGGLLLKFCNKLSEYLNERDSTKYHDIDNTLLVRMIEFLNFNAKVKFMKAGFINGVELCDFEMAHVEILKILLNSDWKDIPTMQELSHPEVIRRLRDKIIDSERFSLAIDVTGKCGLDPSAVWFAWGLSQLKSGDFRDARENFSKCLTPLKSVEDKTFQQNVFYLTQIIEVIEASPLLAFAQGDLLSPLHALQDLNRISVTGCSLDVKRYNEIMYYLNKYGSHSQVVKFFVRHELFKKAAEYIKAQRCSIEVFFEDLLLRSFQIGSFEALAREMESMDPTLNKWKEYLSKSCQYLSKKGLYNCLYQMQLFLKDYFRAATTCIRFFLGTSGNAAGSFKELHKRIYHLEDAKKHLDTLLREKAIVKSTFVSHIGSQRTDDPFSAPLVQEVSISELKSHLNTINLQIEVLNFFNKRPEKFEDEKGKIPTLFGNGRERSDVIARLLMESIGDAFSLVSRIIQAYRLPAVAVFSDCVQGLVQKKSYDHVFTLMKTIEGIGMMPDKGRDHLLLKVVKRISAVGESAKQASPFIKMIKDQSAKVEALITCGRLRDAYVEATKENQVENVERILREAERLNQKYVVDICQKFLKNFEERQDRKGKIS